MEKIRENTFKKTLYLFKKFARENRFWEEYKRLSIPLQTTSFKEVVKTSEPIQLIQAIHVFCLWPSDRLKFWSEMSCAWAIICCKESLFYNLTDMTLHLRASFPFSKEECISLLSLI